MIKLTALHDKAFWRILKKLDSMAESVDLGVLLSSYEIEFGEKLDEKVVHEVVSFLKGFNYPIEMRRLGTGPSIRLTGERPYLPVELSISDWLALQAHFPLLKEESDHEFSRSLLESLNSIESRPRQFDLYKKMEEEEKKKEALDKISNRRPSVSKAFERAISEEALIVVEFSDGKSHEVYPYQVIILDGELSVIAEDTTHRHLLSFVLDDVKECSLREVESYEGNFSQVEIEDFVYGIRTVAGSEERLVLKVTAPEKVNLRPAHHFLGNPYVTTNADGDLIWAASVEVSEKLFSWLFEVSEDIEILDPQELKIKFDEFLESKVSSIENDRPQLKKAS